MNKQQFFNILKKEISSLPKEEQTNVIEFYEEHFNEKNNDDEVIKNLPHPTIISENLYKELGVNNTIKNKRSPLDIISISILVIFLGPFILSLIILAFSFLVIIPGSLALSFCISAFTSIFATIAGMFYNPQTVMTMFGMLLLSIGLAMFFIKISIKCFNWFVLLCTNIFHFLRGGYSYEK